MLHFPSQTERRASPLSYPSSPLPSSSPGPNPHHRRVKERGLGLQTGTKGKVEKGSFPLFFMKVLSRLASPLHSSPRPGAGYHLRVTPEGRPGGGGRSGGKERRGAAGKDPGLGLSGPASPLIISRRPPCLSERSVCLASVSVSPPLPLQMWGGWRGWGVNCV